MALLTELHNPTIYMEAQKTTIAKATIPDLKRYYRAMGQEKHRTVTDIDMQTGGIERRS